MAEKTERKHCRNCRAWNLNPDIKTHGFCRSFRIKSLITMQSNPYAKSMDFEVITNPDFLCQNYIAK